MITMNKLYKCALGLLTAFILSFACFSSALNVQGLISDWNLGGGETQSFSSVVGNFVCFKTNNSNCTSLTLTAGNNSTTGNPYQNLVCLFFEDGLKPSMKNNINSNCTYNLFRLDLDTITEEYCSVMSSLECQTEYNLIPISEVTPNYCALNFGMIDPQECPINSGTGSIVRSNLMINDVPYAQNQNINVFIPDFLAWNISFNDLYTVIEVEGYNADESYIENVINNEKLTPTNEDFQEMLTGFMTNYFPYLALAIVFLYLARKIYKLFK